LAVVKHLLSMMVVSWPSSRRAVIRYLITWYSSEGFTIFHPDEYPCFGERSGRGFLTGGSKCIEYGWYGCRTGAYVAFSEWYNLYNGMS
jgi:hypothetical protein